MNLTKSTLRHPRTQWEIESSLWHAIECGFATACSAAGKEIVTIVHVRTAVPAFSFWRDGQDVTDRFVHLLRTI